MTSKKMRLGQLTNALNKTLDILQGVQYGDIEQVDGLTPDEEILLSDLLTVLDDIQKIDNSL